MPRKNMLKHKQVEQDNYEKMCSMDSNMESNIEALPFECVFKIGAQKETYKTAIERQAGRQQAGGLKVFGI